MSNIRWITSEDEPTFWEVFDTGTPNPVFLSKFERALKAFEIDHQPWECRLASFPSNGDWEAIEGCTVISQHTSSFLFAPDTLLRRAEQTNLGAKYIAYVVCHEVVHVILHGAERGIYEHDGTHVKYLGYLLHKGVDHLGWLIAPLVYPDATVDTDPESYWFNSGDVDEETLVLATRLNPIGWDRGERSPSAG